MSGCCITAICAWSRNFDMQYSLEWLKRHIDGTLPETRELVSVITEKAFEVEAVVPSGSDTVIEAKILPDRAHDALSHRGMAREIAALFGLKRKELLFGWPKADTDLSFIPVRVEEPLCRRYIGVRVEGVFPKESPRWLRTRLETIGQRSINTLVDITNFVMFDIGQPMHVFDAKKIRGGITIRLAKKGETMTTLDNKTLELHGTELVIADDEAVLALAGVKGGKKAEVDATTTSIVLESANFDPVRTRMTSVRQNIRTDASKRYENGITSRFAEEGAKEALALLLEIFPDARVAEPQDAYPRPEREFTTGVSVGEIRRLLGIHIEAKDVAAIFKRAGIPYELVSPRDRIVESANAVLGKPYVRGASVTYDAPERFDCSSLVAWAYKEAGLSIPRVSVDQYVYARPIEESDLRPGDLVFVNTGEEKTPGGIHYATREWMKGMKVPEGVDHVGIWIGNGQIVHASSAEGKVVKEHLRESARFAVSRSYRRIIDEAQRFVVKVPPERLDLRRPHDLVEEVGRHVGYNKVAAVLPDIKRKGVAHKRLYYGNVVRKLLIENGYSEVYTYSFAKKGDGDIEVENPVGKDRPFIRRNLANGIKHALVWNMYNGPVIGAEDVRIFELGNVFSKDGEEIREHHSLVIASAPGNKKRKQDFEEEIHRLLKKIHETLGVSEGENVVTALPPDPASIKFGAFVAEIDFDACISGLPEPAGYDPLPQGKDVRYRPVSAFPFVVRDISLFVPESVSEDTVERVLRRDAGDLVVRCTRFDRFQKAGDTRVSYGFRFVFQSFERTLTDEEVNSAMERVYAAAREEGWETR